MSDDTEPQTEAEAEAEAESEEPSYGDLTDRLKMLVSSIAELVNAGRDPCPACTATNLPEVYEAKRDTLIDLLFVQAAITLDQMED
jgi:hypothetical protein